MLYVKALFLTFKYRCAGDLKHHLEQSALSKLPDQYQSHLRQSAASEDDDMSELITYKRKMVLGTNDDIKTKYNMEMPMSGKVME